MIGKRKKRGRKTIRRWIPQSFSSRKRRSRRDGAAWWLHWKLSLLVAALVVFLGWMAWRSDYVQMRFVYLWPYQQEIVTYSHKNNVDPFLTAAVIKNESGFKPGAVSRAGAIGLMQIMPDTGQWIAEQMGLKNYSLASLYQPETNIRMGCWYLSELHHEFKGNMVLLLIAYNAGRGNTKVWMKANDWDYDYGNVT
ncbi:MAG: lytic transglycosylase domain-containing protein, partial [Succiniclasticum sp.]